MIEAAQLRKKLPTLKAWLSAAGAEILAPTNEWEMARFKAGGVTGIVYCNSVGRVKLQGPAQQAVMAFLSGQRWSAGVAVPRKRMKSDFTALVKRDGDACFLCRQPLGDDITVEHLVPVAHGGPNHISNKVLAHAACNLRMGHLSAMEKINMRDAATQAPSAAKKEGQP